MSNISIAAKNYEQYVSEIYRYIENNYPDLRQAFLDNSIGSLLLELNAGIGDSLNFHLDRTFNELFIDTANNLENLYKLAYNNGVKLPNKTASIVVCDFTVNIPTKGDSFDSSYLPIIKAGTQVVGSSIVFEVINDIDFNSNVSAQGLPNIKFKPILDSSGNILYYEFVKREVLYSGFTKQYSQIVSQVNDFFTFIIPDRDIISIDSIIIKNGINNTTTIPDNEFFIEDNRFYEVDYLAQNKVFKEIGVLDGMVLGDWIETEKRFIKEFTPRGFCKVTFGNGTFNNTSFKQILSDDLGTYNYIKGLSSNNALGVKVPNNSTIYVKYRVGGGAVSNIGVNTINKIGLRTVTVKGGERNKSLQVERTLRVNNPTPSFGGKDVLTEDEVRYLTKFNLAAQKRAVTENDYELIIATMEGKFGKPYKVKAYLDDNKLSIGLLGITEDGKLSSQVPNVLKDNIKNYLKNFRMINDYVNVVSNKVINLSFIYNITITSNANAKFIGEQITLITSELFSSTKIQIGQNISLGNLYKEIYKIDGVVTINDIKVFNIFDTKGLTYSSELTTMPFVDDVFDQTQFIQQKEIVVKDFSLFIERDSIFEIRYPQKDIIVNSKVLSF
jgi:hypothetical protein